MDIQINQNFVYILNGLLVALGANMAPKASQKGGRGVAKVVPFSGLEGSWGVLGPLGAQELMLIEFWLIFYDFWLIFDDFLDDFPMICVTFVFHF